MPEPQPTEQPCRGGDFDVGDWLLGRDPGSARDASLSYRIVLLHVAVRVKVDTCSPICCATPNRRSPLTCDAADPHALPKRSIPMAIDTWDGAGGAPLGLPGREAASRFRFSPA
jgi:hypothetical protein